MTRGVTRPDLGFKRITSYFMKNRSQLGKKRSRQTRLKTMREVQAKTSPVLTAGMVVICAVKKKVGFGINFENRAQRMCMSAGCVV